MVEKASNAFTLEKLRNLQWQKVFHMFYIEPVVFMLLFSHTLSGEWPGLECPASSIYLPSDLTSRHYPAQPGHLPDVHGDLSLQWVRLQATGREERQRRDKCGSRVLDFFLSRIIPAWSSFSSALQAIETELQPYVANLFLSRTLLESIVPAFCGLFIGSWSDHYGRKPLLIVSMIGKEELLTNEPFRASNLSKRQTRITQS